MFVNVSVIEIVNEESLNLIVFGSNFKIERPIVSLTFVFELQSSKMRQRMRILKLLMMDVIIPRLLYKLFIMAVVSVGKVDYERQQEEPWQFDKYFGRKHVYFFIIFDRFIINSLISIR